MPYTVDNPPEIIELLPRHAKEIWISAYNAAAERGEDEGTCAAIAWAAVKNDYEKNPDGRWIKKAMKSDLSFDELRQKIGAKLNPGAQPWNRWVRELYEDRVIFMDETEGWQLYEATYQVDEEGEVTLGEARRVKMVYVAARSAGVDGDTQEIQILPYGKTSTNKGDFILDEVGMEAIIADFEAKKNDIVIDYEHQTLSGGEAPAAGWIKKLVNKGKEGLWAVVEWTDRAKEYLKNREYRYLSPVFLNRLSDGRVTGLVNAGLTNAPAIDGMVPIVNKTRGGDTHPGSKDKHPSKKKEETVMKKLFAVLGLTETATEDDAIAAVNALKADAESIVANKAVFEALGVDASAPESEVVGVITALKASHSRVETATQEADALRQTLQERDADDAVLFAMNAGKITPAERDWARDYAMRDLEGFKTYVNKTPVKVPRGSHAKDSVFSTSLAYDEAQIMVNNALGISDELHRKHHKVVA